MMNTSQLTTLSWSKLVCSDMIGNDILVEYASPPYGLVLEIIQKWVTVVGTSYVGNDRVLLVHDPDADDIFIIKRDGQGYLWDAYMKV